jgi:hypothetical protein
VIAANHPFAQRALNARDENGLEGCATCGRPRSAHPGSEIEATVRPEHGRERPPLGYPPSRKAGELDPEWVMAGVDVPAGKRLYASRDLKGSAFELAVDEHMNGEGWHLSTVMQKMLVITKPTYGECLAELMLIWQNWQNEGRELPAGPAERRAL